MLRIGCKSKTNNVDHKWENKLSKNCILDAHFMKTLKIFFIFIIKKSAITQLNIKYIRIYIMKKLSRDFVFGLQIFFLENAFSEFSSS